MDDERTKVNGLFERLTFPPFFKGARIKLRDETWAVAVENCLKGLAFGFCCTDNHDALVLRGLMKGLCPPNKIPQIIVSKFQVFKTKFRCFWQVEIDYICAYCVSCRNFTQLIRKNCTVLRVKVTRSQDGCAKDGDYFTMHVSPATHDHNAATHERNAICLENCAVADNYCENCCEISVAWSLFSLQLLLS